MQKWGCSSNGRAGVLHAKLVQTGPSFDKNTPGSGIDAYHLHYAFLAVCFLLACGFATPAGPANSGRFKSFSFLMNILALVH